MLYPGMQQKKICVHLKEAQPAIEQRYKDSQTNGAMPTQAMGQSQPLRGPGVGAWRPPKQMPLNTRITPLSDSLIIQNTSDCILVSQCALPGRRECVISKHCLVPLAVLLSLSLCRSLSRVPSQQRMSGHKIGKSLILQKQPNLRLYKKKSGKNEGCQLDVDYRQ